MVAVGLDGGGLALLRPAGMATNSSRASEAGLGLQLERHSMHLPLRLVQTTSDNAGAICHVSWSLDGSRILTLSAEGTMVCWALHPWESHMNVDELDAATTPVPVHALTAQQLLPQRGPFAVTQAVERPPRPLVGAFFPALTIFGGQPIVAMGFDNGDVMTCNLESKWRTFPGLNTESLGAAAHQSFVSDDIPVKLFRGERGCKKHWAARGGGGEGADVEDGRVGGVGKPKRIGNLWSDCSLAVLP